MKLRRLALNTALLLASGAGTLLAAEAALRLVSSGAADGDTTLLTEFDSLLGWRKVPGASQVIHTAEFEIEETINSQGLRGPERPYAKPDGVRRVLLLGDSFLEGYTVELDALCSTVLERQLNAQGPAPYEVINAGTAGYSTDQQLLFFESEGVRYAPDLTVLMFYVNDVWFNGQSRYWRGSKPRFVRTPHGLELTNVPVPPPDSSEFAFAVQGGSGVVRLVRRAEAWLAQHSAIYQLARSALSNSVLPYRATIALGLAEVPGEFRGWHAGPDPEVEEAWAVTAALLDRLSKATVAAGGDLLIFYVPSRPAVYPDDWRQTARKYGMTEPEWHPTNDGTRLNEICQSLALRCLPSIDDFRREADTMGPDGRLLYFERDAHWTAAGHEVAARILAEAVLETDANRHEGGA